MPTEDSSTKYFLYSDEQIKEKNNILGKLNKRFEPGTIVIRGIKYKYTQLSNTADMPRFTDVRVVASGNPKDFTYTRPTSIKLEGN